MTSAASTSRAAGLLDWRVMGVIALSLVWAVLLNAGSASPDLLASWMAGEAYSAGAYEQIYPNDTRVYTMRPPAPWVETLRARGYEGDIFPFVYPPIWAALMAKVTALTSFGTLQAIALVVNPVLLGATVVLAARMLQHGLEDWVFVAIGLGLLHFTLIGQVALHQDQPQILVSFLIVLALERAQNGRPIWAGAALALAAAIKIYPVFFALAWLARGKWRAAGWFIACGASLGLLSIATAGWPLHRAFLDQVGVIGGTVFANPFVFSLDPVLVQIFAPDRLDFMPLPHDPGTGWFVTEKTALWKGATMLALLAVSLGSARLKTPLAWPLLALAIGLLSPLSWGYHYITAVAFAPILIARLPLRAGVGLTALIFLPLAPVALHVIHKIPAPISAVPYVGTFSLLVLTLALWAVARKSVATQARAA